MIFEDSCRKRGLSPHSPYAPGSEAGETKVTESRCKAAAEVKNALDIISGHTSGKTLEINGWTQKYLLVSTPWHQNLGGDFRLILSEFPAHSCRYQPNLVVCDLRGQHVFQRFQLL